MTEERYLGMDEFVPQVLLYLGKLEEHLYSTYSSTIVYKCFDPHCILCTGPCICCLTHGELFQQVEFYSPLNVLPVVCNNALPGLPDSVPNSVLSTWCTLVVYCDSTHPCLVSLRHLSQNKYIPQPPTAEIYYKSCLMIDRHNRHCQDTLTLEQKLDMHNWSMQVNMSIFWHDYC
jgi:hypothetical protein